MDDEGLKVRQPQRGQEHDRYQDSQQRTRKGIAKNNKNGEAKERKVGEGPDGREGYRANMRVFAPQDLSAAGNYRATQVLPDKILNGQIDCIAESDERHDGCNQVRPNWIFGSETRIGH